PRGRRHHRGMRRRKLLSADSGPPGPDGGLPAQVAAGRRLRPLHVHRALRRRAVPVALRRLGRGARRSQHHRGLRGRPVLPNQSGLARPDGRLRRENLFPLLVGDPMRSALLGSAFFAAAVRASAATVTVTSNADSGAGTLRQAILDANGAAGADTIAFAIPGSGVHTIAPASALPSITAQL